MEFSCSLEIAKVIDKRLEGHYIGAHEFERVGCPRGPFSNGSDAESMKLRTGKH